MKNSKEKIDVVLITTLRPDILHITLSSFKYSLLHQYDVRIIVNIDPVGEKHSSQKEILEICHKYFDNAFSRTPEKASFSSAVLWCWSQVKTRLFLHLEDDWCLKSKVNAGLIKSYFLEKDIVSVRFNITRNIKSHINSDGKVYSNRLNLNPCIFRTSYIKSLLPNFDTNKDPEKQFNNKLETKKFPKATFLIYGKKSDKSLVIDTGKKWRKQIGLDKWNLEKEKSVTWKKAEKTKSWLLKPKCYVFIYYWSKKYCQNLEISNGRVTISKHERKA